MKEYKVEVQKFFLEVMLQDAQSFVRVQNIYNPINFDRSLQGAAKFIAEHADKYKTLPTYEQIKAVTEVELKPIPDINEQHIEWFMDEFEKFTKDRELERAILKSADLLAKGERDQIESLIKSATQISLTKDLGIEYFEDPRSRLERVKNNKGQVSTGWPALDYKLFGGFGRKELNIFAGGSGSGKSLFLQNIAVNWALMGLNGVYLSLELSEDLCARRIDSMVSGVPSAEVLKNIDDVELKVKMVGKKAGKLRIKEMPAQSNINQIRAYLKELQIQTGIKIDFLMVDYLDLLMPVSAKVSPNDLFVKDKYVSEELRNLAKELDILLVTASQLNRSAVEEIEFDHSHISGGISKINTADNVFGIFTSRAMRERGRYQLQLMKTRSSSGVGTKVDLEFDMATLRITNLDQDQQSAGSTSEQAASILNNIKATSTVKSKDEVQDMPKIQGDVQASKLKNLLAGLKSQK
ncbi:MAG: hypothetical protein N2235_01565 [Fischerella sp.]|nr:hypothetical protein [Fischerella sp.]